MRTHKKNYATSIVDEKGNHYHLMTTRLDLGEKEILDAYKNENSRPWERNNSTEFRQFTTNECKSKSKP